MRGETQVCCRNPQPQNYTQRAERDREREGVPERGKKLRGERVTQIHSGALCQEEQEMIGVVKNGFELRQRMCVLFAVTVFALCFLLCHAAITQIMHVRKHNLHGVCVRVCFVLLSAFTCFVAADGSARKGLMRSGTRKFSADHTLGVPPTTDTKRCGT